MQFVAMNRFQIRAGHEEAFERVWAERESRLKETPGFREFRLLKGPQGDGVTLYISHAVWESRADFEAWTKSAQFRAAHKDAGASKTQDAMIGPPQFEGFETVLHEA